VNVEEYGRMYEAEERQWWYAGMRAISFALLRGIDTPGRRLLDAGCGTGNNLAHLARFGRTVGIDLSEEALRFCKGRGVAAGRARLLALPFPDAAFGGVTSFDVLYHRWVEDDRAAVREMARVLAWRGCSPPAAGCSSACRR
jgi:ubiquinone/menaquinone biosynthesis C-methylase UbiE